LRALALDVIFEAPDLLPEVLNLSVQAPSLDNRDHDKTFEKQLTDSIQYFFVHHILPL